MAAAENVRPLETCRGGVADVQKEGCLLARRGKVEERIEARLVSVLARRHLQTQEARAKCLSSRLGLAVLIES